MYTHRPDLSEVGPYKIIRVDRSVADDEFFTRIAFRDLERATRARDYLQEKLGDLLG